jgi:hypothetical protein
MSEQSKAIGFYANEGSLSSGNNLERSAPLKAASTTNHAAVAYSVTIPISTQNALGRLNGRQDWPLGIGKDGDPSPTLSKSHCHAVAKGGGREQWRNGRPQTYPARVRAFAGISRRSHAHPVARQVAAGLPGWAALQGAGQQHGRSLHGVDRQAYRHAASRPSALPLRMQRDRSGLGRMGTAGLGACGICRGGEVSERGLGASLAASAEHGGYDTP